MEGLPPAQTQRSVYCASDIWIREPSCGILVYGEQERLGVGDSVEVHGCLRITNGGYFFPETGLATLGDVAIENMGVTPHGMSDSFTPVSVTAGEFCAEPEIYGGNLVTVPNLQIVFSVRDENGDLFLRAASGSDSLIIYIDGDIGASPNPSAGTCCTATGVVVRMSTPAPFRSCPTWCIAPRSGDDVMAGECFSDTPPTTWGGIKTVFGEVPSTKSCAQAPPDLREP